MREKIKEFMREKINVALGVEKMVRSCFRWFGHVRIRLIEVPVKRVDLMEDSNS